MNPACTSVICQYSQRKICGDAWQDTDDRAFTNDLEAPIHPDAFTKWSTEFVKRSGLPCVHIHSLRHTCASLMIADGTPLVVVSKYLGIIALTDEKASQVTEKFADVIAPEPSKEQKRKTTA